MDCAQDELSMQTSDGFGQYSLPILVFTHIVIVE